MAVVRTINYGWKSPAIQSCSGENITDYAAHTASEPCAEDSFPV